jgi:membrane protease YdiL (CAAX protease family)
MIQTLITLLFVLIPINWITVFKEKNLKEALIELLPKSQGLKKEALGSVALFGALFLGFMILLMSFSIIETSTGIELNDLEKVDEIIGAEIALNLSLFLVSVIILVFIEEFFFRSFLVPRLGLIISTLIFTFFHYGYGSIAELIGVFILGLILAYWFKKRNSLIQNYFGHLFYNLLAIVFYILI